MVVFSQKIQFFERRSTTCTTSTDTPDQLINQSTTFKLIHATKMLYVLYVITFLFIYVCHLGYHVLYMAVFILCTVLATGESSIYLNFISLFITICSCYLYLHANKIQFIIFFSTKVGIWRLKAYFMDA